MMTSDASQHSADAPNDAALAHRLDALVDEIRRQGRAAVAAQAAAQACLELLQRAEPERSGTSADASNKPSGEPAPDVARRWLEELLPVFDALDRAVRQAEDTRGRAGPLVPLRALDRFVRRGEPAAMAEGLALIKKQLDQALHRLGVHIDAPAGGPPDAHRHRVVEVRPARTGRPGEILELVRPGYSIDGRLVREAEVVVRQRF